MTSAAAHVEAVPVRRLRETPVIEYGAVAGYGPIFNAGVIEVDGVLHLFARGVRAGYARNAGPGPRFVDYVSDVLVFTSRDGADYAFQQVIVTAGDLGAYAVEDPRVQRVRAGGREHLLMTYTHLPYPNSGQPWQVGVCALAYADGRFSPGGEPARVVGPEATQDKDGVLFNLADGRVGLIHRIHPDMQLAVFDSLEHLYSADGAYWQAHVRDLDRHTLIRPRSGSLGVGAGAPPLEVGDGLVLFYHERDGGSRYTIRAALLDRADGRVISLLDEPLLRPELRWEREGDVDDVVFVQGAVMRGDGTLYLTYGAADRCIGAAEVETDRLVRALRAAA